MGPGAFAFGPWWETFRTFVTLAGSYSAAGHKLILLQPAILCAFLNADTEQKRTLVWP